MNQLALVIKNVSIAQKNGFFVRVTKPWLIAMSALCSYNHP
jgi:hypothetical protein